MSLERLRLGAQPKSAGFVEPKRNTRDLVGASTRGVSRRVGCLYRAGTRRYTACHFSRFLSGSSLLYSFSLLPPFHSPERRRDLARTFFHSPTQQVVRALRRKSPAAHAHWSAESQTRPIVVPGPSTRSDPSTRDMPTRLGARSWSASLKRLSSRSRDSAQVWVRAASSSATTARRRQAESADFAHRCPATVPRLAHAESFTM
ncbi:hypothetical protein C8J57DRAFT_1585216 [Mycena rebaudengoi]|nr:hypothetical protein C8J57DRAFT_1585216 [Mycena rebaudengoi]